MQFRILLTLLSILLSIPSFHYSQTQPEEILQFEYTTLDLGKFKCSEVANENGTIEIKYPFTNISTDTIYIATVKTSGGPFVPSQYREPIPPQGKGEIQAIYGCKYRPGISHKTITVVPTQRRNDTVNLRPSILRLKLEILPENDK